MVLPQFTCLTHYVTALASKRIKHYDIHIYSKCVAVHANFTHNFFVVLGIATPKCPASCKYFNVKLHVNTPF